MLAHQEEVQIFTMSMKNIDKQLALDQECHVKEISIKHSGSQHLKEVHQQLPAEYHEYLNVFDRFQASKLPPHRSYDHKIKLAGDAASPQSWAYCMSPYKLQKVKEYLNENLFKGFITLSKAAYSSPVLFAMKVNGDLQFCVNY